MQWLYLDLNGYLLDFRRLIILFEKLILSKQQSKILLYPYWGQRDQFITLYSQIELPNINHKYYIFKFE